MTVVTMSQHVRIAGNRQQQLVHYKPASCHFMVMSQFLEAILA